MPHHEQEQAIANKLLIAMPDQGGGFFEKSVILMLEHSPQGAMGLTLTHPADIDMGMLLDNLDITHPTHLSTLTKTVMLGGPVQPERGFILHRGSSRWENTAHLGDQLSLTVSLDFLTAVAQQRTHEDFEVFLGYAGWSAGQLEQELSNNQWLFAEANLDIIFDLAPEVRWQVTLERLGIQSHQISRTAGHA